MRRFFAVVILAIYSVLTLLADEPVKWSAEVDVVSNCEGVLRINADIESGWKLYGLDMPKGGPVSTEINVSMVNGEIENVNALENCVESFDEVFQLPLKWWHDKATFVSRFNYDSNDAVIAIKIRYMTCNGTICNRPTVKEFSVKINNNNDK